MKKLKIWFDQQNSWTRSMIAKNKNDPLWRHVGLIMAQFDGLVAGYKSVAKQVYLLTREYGNNTGSVFHLVECCEM